MRNIVFAAVLIIVVVLAAASGSRGVETLEGFWSGDSEFLRAAGLSQMLVFVSPASGRSRLGCRDISVVMTGADGGAVANRNMSLDFGGNLLRNIGWGAKTLLSRSTGPVVMRNVAVSNGGEVFPQSVDVKLDTAAGSLSITDGDQLLAFLWRDNEASYDAMAAFKHQYD